MTVLASWMLESEIVKLGIFPIGVIASAGARLPKLNAPNINAVAAAANVDFDTLDSFFVKNGERMLFRFSTRSAFQKTAVTSNCRECYNVDRLVPWPRYLAWSAVAHFEEVFTGKRAIQDGDYTLARDISS
jgi:hypothetical protein